MFLFYFHSYVSELFPTCSDKKRYNRKYRVSGENWMKNGFHTIDPDGVLGVRPFVVKCSGYITQIPVYPGIFKEIDTFIGEATLSKLILLPFWQVIHTKRRNLLPVEAKSFLLE